MLKIVATAAVAVALATLPAMADSTIRMVKANHIISLGGPANPAAYAGMTDTRLDTMLHGLADARSVTNFESWNSGR